MLQGVWWYISYTDVNNISYRVCAMEPSEPVRTTHFFYTLDAEGDNPTRLCTVYAPRDMDWPGIATPREPFHWDLVQSCTWPFACWANTLEMLRRSDAADVRDTSIRIMTNAPLHAWLDELLGTAQRNRPSAAGIAASTYARWLATANPQYADVFGSPAAITAAPELGRISATAMRALLFRADERNWCVEPNSGMTLLALLQLIEVNPAAWRAFCSMSLADDMWPAYLDVIGAAAPADCVIMRDALCHTMVFHRSMFPPELQGAGWLHFGGEGTLREAVAKSLEWLKKQPSPRIEMLKDMPLCSHARVWGEAPPIQPTASRHGIGTGATWTGPGTDLAARGVHATYPKDTVWGSFA